MCLLYFLGNEDAQIRLNKAVMKLKTTFRDYFWEGVESERASQDITGGSSTTATLVSEEVLSMRRASAWYFCTYNQRTQDDDSPPLVSFPWVVHDLLSRIRIRNVA